MLPESTRCSFPGCGEFGGHDHHITYDPECKKPLCELHHKEITHLNGIQSRKYGYTKLTNKFRWWIWYQWTEGKLRSRRTKKAREWTDGWGQPTIVMQSVPDLVLATTPASPKQKRKKAKPKKRIQKKAALKRLKPPRKRKSKR